jgi:hypothetical protein
MTPPSTNGPTSAKNDLKIYPITDGDCSDWTDVK